MWVAPPRGRGAVVGWSAKKSVCVRGTHLLKKEDGFDARPNSTKMGRSKSCAARDNRRKYGEELVPLWKRGKRQGNKWVTAVVG